MGHLVNPISARLSVNTYWDSTWVLKNNFNYVYLFKNDYILYYILDWFIKKSKFSNQNLLLSHYKVYRISNKIFINLYYYNGIIGQNNYKIEAFLINKVLKIKNENKLINIENIYKYIIQNVILSLYWKVLNRSLKHYLKSQNTLNSKYYFNVYNVGLVNIPIKALTNYISLKLQKRYSLNWVLKPVLKDLNTKVKQGNFLGYKIVCSGRFTRKQIATYSWTKNGAVSLNTMTDFINYSEARIRLKYGLCGIKVWINYGKNNRNNVKREFNLVEPVYNPFDYFFNKKNNVLSIKISSWLYSFIKLSNFKTNNKDLYNKYLYIKVRQIIQNIILTYYPKKSKIEYKIVQKGDNINVYLKVIKRKTKNLIFA